MFFPVMAHLMGKHRHQLINRLFFNQGVKQHNAPEPAEAGEEGVGFAGAL